MLQSPSVPLATIVEYYQGTFQQFSQNFIREEGKFKNVKLAMAQKEKGKSNKPKKYGLYSIDPSGNKTLNWYSNTTLWNETSYDSKNCLVDVGGVAYFVKVGITKHHRPR